MRLIDADALIDRIESDIKVIEDIEPQMAMGAIGVLNTIKKAPTEKLQLPPETPTTSKTETVDTDLISRQAAIEALGEEPDIAQDTDEEWAEHDTWVIHRNAIGSLPPVEPKLVSGNTISKEALIQSFLADCECKDRSEAKAVTCSLDTMLELIDDAPPSEPKPVCEDAISKEWILKELNAESEKDYPSFRRVMEKVEDAPPVEPKRPKGEWVSCSEPPKDRRNVFLAHGTNDFKSCCIGHYEQGMGWYEDRNFFAKPIYDCKYWCDIPELPNLGNNQFGTGVSADMRGDKEWQ